VGRQRRKPLDPGSEKYTAADHEATCSQLDQVFEDCVEVAFAAGILEAALGQKLTPTAGR
jgi:hypothetical protein